MMTRYEASLIEAQGVPAFGSIERKPTRLPWEGREFLAAAGDGSRWEESNFYGVGKSGKDAFDALKPRLLKLVMEQVFPSPSLCLAASSSLRSKI